jgi:hypothetical protein
MNALLVWPKFDSFSFCSVEKVCALAGVKYMTPPLGLLTVAGGAAQANQRLPA